MLSRMQVSRCCCDADTITASSWLFRYVEDSISGPADPWPTGVVALSPMQLHWWTTATGGGTGIKTTYSGVFPMASSFDLTNKEITMTFYARSIAANQEQNDYNIHVSGTGVNFTLPADLGPSILWPQTLETWTDGQAVETADFASLIQDVLDDPDYAGSIEVVLVPAVQKTTPPHYVREIYPGSLTEPPPVGFRPYPFLTIKDV